MFLPFVRILYTTGPFVGGEHTTRAGHHSSHPTKSVGQGDYSEGLPIRAEAWQGQEMGTGHA